VGVGREVLVEYRTLLLDIVLQIRLTDQWEWKPDLVSFNLCSLSALNFQGSNDFGNNNISNFAQTGPY